MISKEILDLVTLVAGIFTVIAAVATLFALFFAWRMWKTWKIQQTYSLHREKLIENEINIIALYHYQGNVMKQMIELCQIEFTRKVTDEELDHYQNILKKIRDKEEEFEDKYGFCLFILERYGIHYDNDVRFDLLEFKKQTSKWIREVQGCNNSDDLKIVIENYFNKSADERDSILKRLSEFREKSLR